MGETYASCPFAQLVACCHCAYALFAGYVWGSEGAAPAGALCRLTCCNPQAQQMRNLDALLAKEQHFGRLLDQNRAPHLWPTLDALSRV